MKIISCHSLSWWKLISEQFSQLQRSELPSELWPHPTQLPARPCPQAPAPVSFSATKVCRQHPTVTTGPHAFTHTSEQLAAALTFAASQPHFGSVCSGPVVPCEDPLLAPSGEADFKAKERRTTALSSPQEGAVSREAGHLPL